MPADTLLVTLAPDTNPAEVNLPADTLVTLVPDATNLAEVQRAG